MRKIWAISVFSLAADASWRKKCVVLFFPYASFKNGTKLIIRYFSVCFFSYSLQITCIKLNPKLKQNEGIDTLLLEKRAALMLYRLNSMPVKVVDTKVRRTSILPYFHTEVWKLGFSKFLLIKI